MLLPPILTTATPAALPALSVTLPPTALPDESTMPPRLYSVACSPSASPLMVTLPRLVLTTTPRCPVRLIPEVLSSASIKQRVG